MVKDFEVYNMVSKIISGAVIGVEGYIVSVETDLSNGLPGMDIVGLPDSAVKESKERVRAAIRNSGFVFPIRRITVNLAPADIRKEGPYFDLPIAVGILTCGEVISPEKAAGVFLTGELSLDGGLRPVNGVLPMIYGAYKAGVRTCAVPIDNADEAALVSGMNVIPINSLRELVEYLNNPNTIKKRDPKTELPLNMDDGFNLDFAEVKGQETVKRGLEIGAAGRHNVLVIGPPGSGKTMMAKRIPGILPDLTFDESLSVTKVYSVAGLVQNKNSLVAKRPFRAPHHTISYSALVGGGRIPAPGEISLAHNGVLFLDELPEFHKNVLEVLRQPMEDGHVTISRVNGTITYPSNFMLICSMNPCPCGHYPDKNKCSCTQADIQRYLGKVSGPLLDRIDIQLEAPKIDYDDIGRTHAAETTADIKARVFAARNIQMERYKNESFTFNADLPPASIEKYCATDAEGSHMLKSAFDSMGLSMRAYHKILKTARTIADLAGREHISPMCLAEAIQYRSLDRKYWG
jgi:magnesium chelatase family protein